MPDAYVTAMGAPLQVEIARFLRAIETDHERKALAPLYLREIVYHLLLSEQGSRLLESAAREAQGNAIQSAISLMKQEIQRSLTVRELAHAVCMSESAFAHLFKLTTGFPPLQFLKQLRMEQASKLLTQGHSVSDVADKVGYSSLPHFSSEFKRHFGDPPRTYASRRRRVYIADSALP
jgi:transcriptional regulator GlxA family with amidase domain